MDSIHPRHPGGTAEDEVESIRAPRVPHATPAFFAAALASSAAASAWAGGESPGTPTAAPPALTQRSAATLTAIAQADARAAEAKAANAIAAVVLHATQRDACAVTPPRLALAALVAAFSTLARSSYASSEEALPLPLSAMRFADALFPHAFFLCWLLCRERSRAAAAAWMSAAYLLGVSLTGRHVARALLLLMCRCVVACAVWFGADVCSAHAAAAAAAARSLYVARAAMQAQGDWRAFWAGPPLRVPTPMPAPTAPRGKSGGSAAALD
jgi:hypothetical protein